MLEIVQVVLNALCRNVVIEEFYENGNMKRAREECGIVFEFYENGVMRKMIGRDGACIELDENGTLKKRWIMIQLFSSPMKMAGRKKRRLCVIG